jgi:hypothetical protein
MAVIMVSAMDHRMTTLQRAFQLAKSGRVSGLSEIISAIKAEGYSANQIEGPILRRQLVDLIKTARAREKPQELAPASRRMTSL